jgi:GWxTD domain-containing protein
MYAYIEWPEKMSFVTDVKRRKFYGTFFEFCLYNKGEVRKMFMKKRRRAPNVLPRQAFPRPIFAMHFGLAFVILLLAVALVFPAEKKVNPSTLALKYREWLKLTAYIIKDSERDVFMRLANDEERDAFIEAFWKQRDPTPATPENEFKDDIIKRFTEANKKFRFGSTREGWMTDRGRFYIILGPPASVESDPGDNDVYPYEIWSYYGGPEKGIPNHFCLVFYQWRNVGEYKLYDPFIDGPARLLVESKDMDPGDYETFYDAIYENHPDLAVVSLSIIPGEIPFSYTPSPENALLMASIIDSPRRAVNDSYATHFLNYRGVVSTEYLTNYVESETDVAVIRDPLTGLAFCDFAMAPKKLSVDYYAPKDQYSCDFQIDVSLRQGEKVVYQYSKEFPLAFSADDLEKMQYMGVSVEDSFPIAEGQYELTVLLRNPVNKEFSTLESKISVPGDAAGPVLLGPFLGYRFGDARADFHSPFQSLNKKLKVDPKRAFTSADDIAFFFNVSGLTEELHKAGSVAIVVKGMNATSPAQKSLSIRLRDQPGENSLSISQSFPASELPPDYYELSIVLKDGAGRVLDEKKADFLISLEKSLPHPSSASKSMALSNSFTYYYMLARQYEAKEEIEKAEAAYQKAYGLNPAYKQQVPAYAGLLVKARKFDAALKLIEDVKDEGKLRFSYYLTKGRALIGLERYREAIENLAQGNRIYNSDTSLLYALGFCYYKTGQKENALAVLNASLKLNANQDEVKKLIAMIQGK